jgi:hypothetical protein
LGCLVEVIQGRINFFEVKASHWTGLVFHDINNFPLFVVMDVKQADGSQNEKTNKQG